MIRILGDAWTVAAKDLRLEGRTFQRIVSMAAFALLAGVLFHYALEGLAGRSPVLVSGLIWVTILFAGVLGIGRSYQLEDENDALEGLLLTPVSPVSIYLGKVLANFVMVSVIVVFTVVVMGVFFSMSFLSLPATFYGLLALGTLGLVAVGTIFSAVTARSSMGETLMPVLLFPLLVPLVVFGAGATGRILAGLPPAEVAGSLRLMAAYVIVGLFAGVLVADSAVGDL